MCGLKSDVAAFFLISIGIITSVISVRARVSEMRTIIKPLPSQQLLPPIQQMTRIGQILPGSQNPGSSFREEHHCSSARTSACLLFVLKQACASDRLWWEELAFSTEASWHRWSEF